MVARAATLSAESFAANRAGRPALAAVLHAQAQGLLLAVAIMDGRMDERGRWVDG